MAERRPRFVFILLAAALLALPSVSHTSTAVPSSITTTAWTQAGSPYLVSVACTVAAGHTLTIDPGDTVEFNADVPFRVEGQLPAQGTETDSVIFQQGTSSWKMIQIMSSDTSVFEYTKITGTQDPLDGVLNTSAVMLDASGAAIKLYNCMITDCWGEVGGAVSSSQGGLLRAHIELRHQQQRGESFLHRERSPRRRRQLDV